jgi:hypothetical protein
MLCVQSGGDPGKAQLHKRMFRISAKGCRHPSNTPLAAVPPWWLTGLLVFFFTSINCCLHSLLDLLAYEVKAY